MALHKRVVKSGAVMEVEYYDISPRVRHLRGAEPPPEPARTPEEQARVNRQVRLKRHIRNMNTNFGPWALYATLTFMNKHLPQTMADAWRVLDNYVRRLQSACPALKLYAVVGRGVTTKRIHCHIVVSGADKRTLIAKWGLGKVRKVKNLYEHCIYDGVDCGRDYRGLAEYLFEHMERDEENKGKQMKRAGRLDKPRKDTPKRVVNAQNAQRWPKTPPGYMPTTIYRSDTSRGAYWCYRFSRLPDVDTVTADFEPYYPD